MQHPVQRRRAGSDRFIDSPRNPRVRDVARLYRRRERDRRELLIAEGAWALRTALAGKARVSEVYYCTDYFAGDESALLARARAAGADVTQLSARALDRLSSRDGPDGIVSVIRRSALRLEDMGSRDSWLVCVAEQIEKPGNLGAIVRTACAAGADLVIATDPVTDVHGPAVVRASLGAVFLIPVVVSTIRDALQWFRDEDVKIYATTPSASTDTWSVDFTGSSAIVIGNEHRGLGPDWLAAADERIAIPMLGPMNSLNASTAAGIALFEAVRQRCRSGYSRNSP